MNDLKVFKEQNFAKKMCMNKCLVKKNFASKQILDLLRFSCTKNHIRWIGLNLSNFNPTWEGVQILWIGGGGLNQPP